MKESKILIVAMMCASLVGLVSCGSDEPEPGPQPEESVAGNSGWVISGLDLVQSGECSWFTYDSYGRIVKEFMRQNGDEELLTYKYSDNRIVMLDGGREDTYWDIRSGLVQNFYDETDEFASYKYDSSRRLISITSDEVGYRFDFKWNSKKITLVTECRTELVNGSVIEQNHSYELRYGDDTSINRECITPLNRLAMTFMFSLYPSINLSGYYGEVPSRLIEGHSGNFYGERVELLYGDVDQNGCPRKITFTMGDDAPETIILTWTRI